MLLMNPLQYVPIPDMLDGIELYLNLPNPLTEFPPQFRIYAWTLDLIIDYSQVQTHLEKFLTAHRFSDSEKKQLITLVRETCKNIGTNSQQTNFCIDLTESLNQLRIFYRRIKISAEQSCVVKKIVLTIFEKIQSILSSQNEGIQKDLLKRFVGLLHELKQTDAFIEALTKIDAKNLFLKSQFVYLSKRYEDQNNDHIEYCFSRDLINRYNTAVNEHLIYATSAVDFSTIDIESQHIFIQQLSASLANQEQQSLSYISLCALVQNNHRSNQGFFALLQKQFANGLSILENDQYTFEKKYINFYLYGQQDTLYFININQDCGPYQQLYPFSHIEKIVQIRRGLEDQRNLNYQKMERYLNESRHVDLILLTSWYHHFLSLFPNALSPNQLRLGRFLKNTQFAGQLSGEILKHIQGIDINHDTFGYFEFLSQDDINTYFEPLINQQSTIAIDYLPKALDEGFIEHLQTSYTTFLIQRLQANPTPRKSIILKVITQYSKELSAQQILDIDQIIFTLLNDDTINAFKISVFKFLKKIEKENNIQLQSFVRMNQIIDQFFNFQQETIAFTLKKEIYDHLYQEVSIDLIGSYTIQYLTAYRTAILEATHNAEYDTFKKFTSELFKNKYQYMSLAHIEKIHEVILGYCTEIFKSINNADPNGPLNISLVKLNLILDQWLLPLTQKKQNQQSTIDLIQNQITTMYDPNWVVELLNAQPNRPNPVFTYACLLDFLFKLNPLQLIEVNGRSQTVVLHIQDLVQAQIAINVFTELEDFFQGEYIEESGILEDFISAVNPISSYVLDHLTRNQYISTENKINFLKKMVYSLLIQYNEIRALVVSEEQRKILSQELIIRTKMRIREELLKKYPNQEAEISALPHIPQNSQFNLVSHIFERIINKFFPRSFHEKLLSIPNFNKDELSILINQTMQEVDDFNHQVLITRNINHPQFQEFENNLFIYYQLRCEIVSNLAVLGEYKPLVKFEDEGFDNEIFLSKNLKDVFESIKEKIIKN